MPRLTFLRHRLFWPTFCAAVFLIGFAPHAFAQAVDNQRGAVDEGERWKVINSLIFAAGLGWALWKYAPSFFNARSADIQKAIKDATGLKIEAEFRRSEVDKRMANIGAEIAKLEEQGRREMEREHGRRLREADDELDHLRKHVAAEIDSLRGEGVRRLRQRTAQLAIESAARRLRDRFASGEAPDLLQDFIHLVQRGNN